MSVFVHARACVCVCMRAWAQFWKKMDRFSENLVLGSHPTCIHITQ